MFNLEIRLSGTVGQLKQPQVYSIMTLIISLNPFIGLGITKFFKELMILTCLQSHKTHTRLQYKPYQNPHFSIISDTHTRITLHILYHTYTYTYIWRVARDERSDGAICGIAVFVGLFNTIQRRRGHDYSSTQETKPTHQE